MVEPLHAIDGGGDGSPSPGLASAVESFETTSAEGALIIDGRFEVRGRIGMGATGSVYQAFDRTLDRQVAIKVIEPNQPQAAAREAQILARVRHRNVVAIHDYGIAPGFRYLVLELLVGRDLRRWLAEQPSTDEIVARFLEAGRGLAAAHAAGLVHRDFKPSNLIVTYDESTPASAEESLAHGRAGRAVVIDFSLARNLDTLDDATPLRSQLRPTRGSSSLAYLAPERLVLDDGDQRCDQFSYCVTFWEALTGENPFTGDDPIRRYQSIARGPGKFEADVPSHVARALRRGLSLSPNARFASMGELLEAIEQPPTLSRRRRPLLSTVLVAATFALGWGLAPEPVIEHAVSDEAFSPKSSAAFILLDSAKAELAAGNTAAAKDHFDAASKLIFELEKASVPYCRFGAEIEGFADALLQAGDLKRGRILYTRAHKFARDCGRPLEYIEQLASKRRSTREAHLTAKGHAPAQSLLPPPNQSFEWGESFQWTDMPSPP